MNPPLLKLMRAVTATAILAIVAAGCSSSSKSQPAPQQAFASPDKAADALVAALRLDESAVELEKIFGPQSLSIIRSGDEVMDQQNKAKFLKAVEEKRSIVPSSDGYGMTLLVGASDWPFPVPIVQADDGWFFDTDAGADEILSRRIGNNELSASQVCLAIADAQREYAMQDADGDGMPAYAPKFFSDAGKKNGLYWTTAPGEKPSPLGSLVASASEEGYTKASEAAGKPIPYHGYHYRMLTSQGPAASGGAIDYLVNGKLIGGFAAVAFPAEYGNSGIMTFMVNHDGVVYQKDLGDKTAVDAEAMKTFDPGAGWKKME